MPSAQCHQLSVHSNLLVPDAQQLCLQEVGGSSYPLLYSTSKVDVGIHRVCTCQLALGDQVQAQKEDEEVLSPLSRQPLICTSKQLHKTSHVLHCMPPPQLLLAECQLRQQWGPGHTLSHHKSLKTVSMMCLENLV